MHPPSTRLSRAPAAPRSARSIRVVHPARRRRRTSGAGVWTGLIAMIALLGLGGWAALQVALGAVESGTADRAVASPSEHAAASPGIVVSSSEQLPVPAARSAAFDRPPATPTPSDWFAATTAAQAAAARELAGELAARPLNADGPRGLPSPAAPTPARGSSSAATAEAAAPPPPIDLAAVRATAVSALPRPAATRTARPIPTRAAAQPARFSAGAPGAVATPLAEPPDRPTLASGAAFQVERPTPARRADAEAARPAGRDTVATRIAQAARPAPTRTPTYQRRPPQWTPRAAGPTPTLGPTRTVRPRQTPAATRSPFTPPPVRNGGNKWGVGVYRDSNRVLDVIRETQPGVILLMDPGEGWARKVRQAAPNAFIVGRRYKREDDQPLDNPTERGEEMADWVAELAVPLKGVVDAWMSYNEVVGHDAFEDYRRYNDLQVAFARRLQDVHGVAAVAGNDGSGAVEPADYPRYFAEAIRASQYFGLHAYSPPATDRMTLDAEWNALRYRKVHEALEAAGIGGKQIVLTESGLGDGFRNGVASDEQMAEDFAWFTRELQRDPYVVGQAAFGLFDAAGAWDRFELTDSNVPKLVPGLLRQVQRSK
ncbi:MAG TPA: hypothetical protein VG370_02575 [Chloroflexota bacterium]|nr:hypothetical protein [Chloroflexota bacterium]